MNPGFVVPIGFVARLNTLVESFPVSIIARIFHFEKQAYLTIELGTGREIPGVDSK